MVSLCLSSVSHHKKRLYPFNSSNQAALTVRTQYLLWCGTRFLNVPFMRFVLKRVNKNTTSPFFNLQLYNVYFWQTTTALINRVDKGKDWQGSFTHEETWGGEGCDTHARTHTHTNKCTRNWIQSHDSFCFYLSRSKEHMQRPRYRNSRQQDSRPRLNSMLLSDTSRNRNVIALWMVEAAL